MFEEQGNLTSDIAAYQKCYGTNAPIAYSEVDGGPPVTAGGEATLDIDNVISIAPKAAQIVYQGKDFSTTSTLDVYNAIISDDKASIITTSYGICESELVGSSFVSSENTLFQEAASQGQSLFDATGDNGSDDCSDQTVSGDDPATQPFVTAVGGTTLSSYSPRQESGWIGSGGGISQSFDMPSYQTGAAPSLHVIGADASGAPCGAVAGKYCREEPDVSLLADPNTGFIDYLDGAWGTTGGTSGAAPIWAAWAALVNSSASCGGKNIGFVNPALYSFAGSAYAADFNDITTGNNDIDSNGHYFTRTGYDMVTGLGTLNGAKLAASFCPGTAPTGPTVDKSARQTGMNTVTAGLSTTVAGDTVVAFVSGDGSTTVSQHATVSGGGLSWSRVKCTCGRNGTAEIWKAKVSGKLTNAAIKATLASTGFAVSETVIAFSNTAGVGAAGSMTAMTGYPKASLTTTAANSLVFGVGTDPVTATGRTVGANQTLFSQAFSGANTFWVQSTTAVEAASGTAVTISDPKPAGHAWSLAVVEIL